MRERNTVGMDCSHTALRTFLCVRFEILEGEEGERWIKRNASIRACYPFRPAGKYCEGEG